MNLGDALKEMVWRTRTTQKKLAEKAGYKTMSSISTPIKNNDMNVSTLLRIADAAGYDLLLVRRNTIEEQGPIKIEMTKRVDGKKGS